LMALSAAMTIYFVRHADKAAGDFFNLELRHQDQPISRYGRLEARRLAAYLRGRDVERVYVSQYIRTGQTIAPFARRAGIRTIVDPRLNEIDTGVLDTMTDEQIEAKYPDVWKAYQERSADFRIPGGETGAEALLRVSGFLEDQLGRTGNAVAVAHDGIIRILLCYLLRIPVYRRFEFRCGTTSIMEVKRDEERDEWVVVRFNQEPQ